MYNLVIIDVQEDFIDIIQDSQALFSNINREIRKAHNNNANIIVIEFPESTYLKPRLTCNELNLSGNNVFFGKKQVMDGSHQIRRVINKHNLISNHFKVCGLYVDACVLNTVDGLSKKFEHSTIEVLKKCCNKDNAIQAFSIMKKNHNVTII